MRQIRTGKLSARPWPRGSRAPYAHRVATPRELPGLTVVRRLLPLCGDGAGAPALSGASAAVGYLLDGVAAPRDHHEIPIGEGAAGCSGTAAVCGEHSSRRGA